MEINVRAHLGENNWSHHDSIDELITLGFNINIGEDAGMHSNSFGIVYPSFSIQDGNWVIYEGTDGLDIKEMAACMTFYVYDNETATFYTIVGVSENRNGDGWRIDFSDGYSAEELLVQFTPIEAALSREKPSQNNVTGNLMDKPSKQKPIVRKKFRI